MAALIRVATWNCFGLPQVTGVSDLPDILRGSPMWADRLSSAAIPVAFQSYDVVCIQENFVGETLDLVKRIRRVGAFDYLWYDRPAFDFGATSIGSGLAILSRFNMLCVPTTYSTSGAGWDRYARKGFVSARVALPGGEVLRLVNTHLQSGSGVEADLARHWQLDELRQHVSSLGSGPVLVCGDFNVTEGSDQYRDLAAEWSNYNLHDLAPVPRLFTSDPSRNEMLKCNEPDADSERIDYVWASTPVAWDVRVPVPPRLVLDSPLPDVVDRPSKCAPGTKPFASDHFGLGLHISYERKKLGARKPTTTIHADGTVTVGSE